MEGVVENYIRGDFMPAQAKSTSEDGSLESFSKSEKEEEDDKQYLYYACDCEKGRHPQGVSCEEDGGE